MTEVIEIPLGVLTKVFLIRAEAGVVLVDAGNPHQDALILAALEVHNVAPEDIKLILITHGHTDHFGSAKAMREATGAAVAIHAADVEALTTGANPDAWSKPTGPLLAFLMGLGIHLPAAGDEAILKPDITFTEAWRLDEYGIAGEVVPAPGHTPGSSVVLLDDGPAILGDLLSANRLTRRPAPPLVAWDLARNWASVRAVLARDPQTLHITHGRTLTPERVREFLARREDATLGRGPLGWLARYHARRDAALIAMARDTSRRKEHLAQLARYRAGATLFIGLSALAFVGMLAFTSAGVVYALYALLIGGLGYLAVDTRIALLELLAHQPDATPDSPEEPDV